MAGPLLAGIVALVGASCVVGGWSPAPGSATRAEASSATDAADYSAGPRQSPTDADYNLVDASGHWAAPRCVGNGRSGPRVQPVFVYRKGHRNRFAGFRTVLQRSTELTTGIFERSSGTRRTVRWVHDSACTPVFWQIAVPASVSHNLVNLRRYLTDRDPRFRRSNRVYSLWVDSTTSPSWSGLGGDRWSATWSSSWGFVWVDAHELVHALGAVSASAPHSTGKGHCYDGNDVMCYSDGGVRWRKALTCPAPAAAYRLDCGDDDYFSVRPKKGSWLARNPGANVANSRFVAEVKPRVLPVEPVEPSSVLRDGYTVSWATEPGVRYDVGTMVGKGSIDWIATDLTSAGMILRDVGWDTQVFVRAVNDAGYSDPVRAAFR